MNSTRRVPGAEGRARAQPCAVHPHDRTLCQRTVGRAKDLIISGGYNIYPKEVELLLDALPGVEESAVVGIPHADLGEAVVGVVKARRDNQVEEEALLAAIRDQLARFKQPRASSSSMNCPATRWARCRRTCQGTLQGRFRVGRAGRSG
ncbi:acyl-CoA synthetase (AMP-forming)/AMP-acid ligase II [Mesorhizobium sp. BE184]|nr:acyl-CoA synthetase (AMP-forming)/AMP-acid ligase II [Mesorhizobium sp. BE184]